MRRPKPPMPGALRLALLVLAALTVFVFVSGDAWYFAVVPVLVLLGVVWAHPALRSWVSGLMVLQLFFYAMVGGLIGIVLGMVAVVLLMAGAASPEGLAYFDLRCPYCGSYRTRLWIRRITCADCKRTWLPRQGGVDVDAFD